MTSGEMGDGLKAIEAKVDAMLHTASRLEGVVKRMDTQLLLTVRALQVIGQSLEISEKLEEIAADLDELHQARRSDFPPAQQGDG